MIRDSSFVGLSHRHRRFYDRECSLGQKIFQLINGQLVEQSEASYEQEEILQRLLKENPDLMDGAQINEDDPRRWLLVKREASVLVNDEIGNYGYVDHLFLDQDGIPTLVEVKRSENTQIRRYVVGQMMDYAANARNTWQSGKIRQYFEANFETEEDASQELETFLGADGDPEQFWEDVETNLKAGKLRLLFVADHIPKELKAIIEFLNEQFTSIEVLVFEIPQFKGGDTITLVPKLIGQTATSRTVKQKGSSRKQWNEKTFFDRAMNDGGEERVRIANEIYEWSLKDGRFVEFGYGSTKGSFIPSFEKGGRVYRIMAVWTTGKIEVYFHYLKNYPPFDSEDKRRELLNRINQIGSISIPDTKLEALPKVDFQEINTENALLEFLKIHEWVIQEIKNQYPTGS